GLALGREPALEVTPELLRDRVLEGGRAIVSLRLRALSPVRGLELRLRLAEGVALADAGGLDDLTLAKGEERTVELGVEARRWGVYDLGSIFVRARDRFGFFLFERSLAATLPLRVYPRPERLRALLAPLETQAHAGNT